MPSKRTKTRGRKNTNKNETTSKKIKSNTKSIINTLQFKYLTTTNLEDAALLAATAFAKTPCYVEILPGDEKERILFLKWLFEKNFLLRMDKQCCRCTYDGNKLVSFFMFTLPDIRHPNFCDMLRVGLISGLWSYGFSTVNPMLATKNWMEEKEQEVLTNLKRKNTKMIRLERMTVLPSYQGKGVGTASLREALTEADKLGLPCILGTQESRNVTFYGRLGFKIVDECHCPVGNGYKNWMMIREPKVV